MEVLLVQIYKGRLYLASQVIHQMKLCRMALQQCDHVLDHKGAQFFCKLHKN